MTTTYETTIRSESASILFQKCPPGLTKFQRIIRNYLSLKRAGWNHTKCEDCQHTFWYESGQYHKTEACADMGGCCYKDKCPWNCVYSCPDCHKPVVSEHYDWADELKCSHCNTTFQPNCQWWGFTPVEHYNRYGY